MSTNKHINTHTYMKIDEEIWTNIFNTTYEIFEFHGFVDTPTFKVEDVTISLKLDEWEDDNVNIDINDTYNIDTYINQNGCHMINYRTDGFYNLTETKGYGLGEDDKLLLHLLSTHLRQIKKP